MTRAAVGTKISITFGGSPLNGDLYEIGFPTFEVSEIDATHYQSEIYREYIAPDLSDPGEMTVKISMDPTDIPEIGGASQTLVITFPDRGTAHADAVWTVPAFVKSVESDAPLEEIMTYTLTFKLAGAVVIT